MTYFDKKFVNAAIEWKIENFCFSVRTEKCHIYSPDFNLKEAHVTRWRMMLEVARAEGTEGNILFYLERLSDSGPDSILVDWELTMRAGMMQYAVTLGNKRFLKNTKQEVILKTVDKVLEYLLPFEPDTLIIRCNLIVRNPDMSVKLNKPVAVGLSCLSSDLKNLLNNNKYQDITIQVGNKDIEAHKVVLSRNKKFKSILDKHSGDVLDLDMFAYDDLYKIIAYIYSGDIEDIIGNPSLSMFKCVKYFECDALWCFYAPEILNMNTRFVVEELSLHWSIHHVSDKEEEVISSPLFKGLNAETTWKLQFFPISTENIEYTALIANLAAGKQPPYFTIEIAIVNERGETYFPQRLLRYNKCYEAAEFPEFTKLEDLVQSSLFIDDTLNILFKVRTSDGEQVSSFGTYITCFITYTQDLSYRKLSSNMDKLLKEKRYADVIIQCEEEKFIAHRCILSTRSQKLARIINRIPQSQIVCLVGIKPNTLRMLLDYIYSGSLEDCEFEDLLLLYEASFCYGISSLATECGEMFLTKVTDENREIVYEAAKKFKDKALMILVGRKR